MLSATAPPTHNTPSQGPPLNIPKKHKLPATKRKHPKQTLQANTNCKKHIKYPAKSAFDCKKQKALTLEALTIISLA